MSCPRGGRAFQEFFGKAKIVLLAFGIFLSPLHQLGKTLQ
jgi:hypothetical protein